MSSIPIISAEDLSNPLKCLVTLNNRVYDMTAFLPDHPGGSDVIIPYRGKDVQTVMTDEISHNHSDSAYEMLEEYFIGVLSTSKASSLADSDATLLDTDIKENDDTSDGKEDGVYATGLSCEEDLNIPTNITTDYTRHKFLDLSKPLLPQIYNGSFSKEFYLQQVHRPRHYPYGSAPLMPFKWMEPFSKTPWWVVPILWTPCVGYGTFLASQGLSTT